MPGLPNDRLVVMTPKRRKQLATDHPQVRENLTYFSAFKIQMVPGNAHRSWKRKLEGREGGEA
jgi:hypothetical protein